MELANTIPLAEGFREACFVQVSPPIGMLPSSDVREKAENALDEILKAATDWQPSTGAAVKGAAYPADTFEFSGTVEDDQPPFYGKEVVPRSSYSSTDP